MRKLHYQDSISEDEKRAFAPFLSEDEELVVVTSFGQVYLRSRYIYYLLWPGAILMILGSVLSYYYKFNFGYGLLIGLTGAAILALLKTFHLYHANRYLLTTRRVIIKQGLFAVKLTSALYDKITHIEAKQSFFDKLLMHYGSVVINTAGANKDEIVIQYIDYPIEFKNLLERLINRERERFGSGSGPVVTVEGELVD